MVVVTEGVGEPLWDRRVVALLEQRDHDELVTVWTAYVNEVACAEVSDQQRAALGGLRGACRVGLGDARGDLGPRVECPPHALAEALGCMISYGDEQQPRQ